MDVYQFVDDLPKFRNAVLTIGTFDGVHVGHQQIISRIRSIANDVNGESILLTFHPHPRLVLNPDDNSLKLINTLEEKTVLLNRYGIDNIIIASFTNDFSQTGPEAYVRDFLIRKINPRVIVIGYDHHFGKGRKGNIETLKKLSEGYKFQVEEISKQIVDDIAVSSTKIRQAIQNGLMKKANELLGHSFSLGGKVIKGNQVGKELGFPTANIFISDKNKLVPAIGIYAAYVWYEGHRYKGMLYIGFRPTFSGKEKSIEVNIFQLDEDLYGKMIQVEVIAEIRKDMHFNSTEKLSEQLSQDKIRALEILM